jgi:cytochrome P450
LSGDRPGSYRGLSLATDREDGDMQAATIDRIEALFERHATDPYPMYRQLRARGPVVVDADRKVVILSYRDARAALTHPACSVDPRHRPATAGGPPGPAPDPDPDPSFIELDPPEHTRLRVLVSQAFAARAARAGPRVQRVVDQCLDRLAPAGRCDAAQDFAYAIPIRVLCDLLGIVEADRQQVQDWSYFVSRSMDPSNPVDPAEVTKVTADACGYLDRLVADRARKPGDDLASALLGSREAGQRLTPVEVTSAVWLLLLSGHQTTSSLIASGLYHLLTEPALRDRVRDRPAALAALADELLRLAPLVPFLFRHARAELPLPCGFRASPGDQLVVLLAAANRDPEQFPDPDTIDLHRPGTAHLSFGAGVHYCLGATLGRMQASVALATFLRRVVEPELAGDVSGHPRSLGGLTTLPITFRAISPPAVERV